MVVDAAGVVHLPQPARPATANLSRRGTEMRRGFTGPAASREPSSGKTPSIFGTWLANHSDRGLRAPSHLELHPTPPCIGRRLRLERAAIPLQKPCAGRATPRLRSTDTWLP